ncbi:alpha/beta fold hydrolase [Streptomyces sp. NPDC005892]|uniref:alpha/beta fold hydrolase n=1 Tax=Streptomyces sp. NPDC005892 TaxID=3155593 RepID=UPI0033D33F34
MNLYCIPYAGCSARVYDSWQQHLPDHVTVVPLELPGRGSRCIEEPIDELPALLEDLYRQLDTGTPYALFGHSYGALIAFELARLPRSEGVRRPSALLVSASCAPRIPAADADSHRLSDAELVERLAALGGTPKELLENEELMEIYLPVIRADYRILGAYGTGTPGTVDCPITAFYGDADDEADLPSVEAWADYTNGPFRVERIPGDHFFLHSAERELVAAVEAACTQEGAVVTPTAAPVTFGQLSVIRDLELSVPDEQSDGNLTAVYTLPAGTTTAEAEAAWSALVERHEALRTVYDRSPAEPLQIVHPFRPVRLDRVELPDGTAEAAEALAADMAEREIRVESEHSWRAVIATHAGEPRHLVCILHHLAVDATACALLEKEFRTLVAGGSLGPGPVPQPVQLALAQRAQERQHRRTVEYWLKAWEGFVEEDRQAGDTSFRVRAALYSEAAMAAAVRVSERLGTSVQSVVLGASALALFRLKGRERATFALVAGNRTDPRWDTLVSSMNQLAPMTVAAGRGTRPEALLRAVYQSGLERLLHGSYSLDELREQLTAAGHPNPDPLLFGCYFNFLGEIAEPPEPGSPLLDGIEWAATAWQASPGFNLRAATGSGLHLSLTASRDYLPPDLVGLYLATVEAVLAGLADGAPSTLDEIDYAPTRRVDQYPEIAE